MCVNLDTTLSFAHVRQKTLMRKISGAYCGSTHLRRRWRYPLEVFALLNFSSKILQIYLKNKMLEDLNKHSVFDFEYAPVEGDILEVTMDGRELSFKYENGKFVGGEEDYSFTPMEELAEGRIDVWSNGRSKI